MIRSCCAWVARASIGAGDKFCVEVSELARLKDLTIALGSDWWMDSYEVRNLSWICMSARLVGEWNLLSKVCQLGSWVGEWNLGPSRLGAALATYLFVDFLYI